MKHMNKFFKLISILVVLGLLFVKVPIRESQAATYITWIAQVPASPSEGQTVRVWINSDTAAGETAALEYRINGEPISNILGFMDSTSYPPANWYIDIPAFPAGTNVEYALAIRGVDEGYWFNGVTKSYTVAAAPVESPCTAACYVDDQTGLDTNPGNISTPFKTIQKGIDLVALGGTVHVAAGTYAKSGAVVLSKAGVNLHLAAGTIIQNSSACFYVSANNVHIYADSPSGAKCVPTSGSNGIDAAAGVQSLRVVNLEFDGVSGTVGTPATDGIHFADTVTNFQIINNSFHGFAGDAIEFFGAPTGTVQDIQGNYFSGNNRIRLASGTLNATYNSWGTYLAPTVTNVTVTPHTHAEIYVTPAVGGEVLKDSNVVFTVKGRIQNLTGAEFELNYPSQLHLVNAVANTTTWNQFASVDSSINGKVKVALSANNAVSVDAVEMLVLTFKANAYAANLTLTFSETTDAFAMNPLPLPNYSNFVYSFAQTGVTDLDIIGLTAVTVTAGAAPYYVGTPIPLDVTLDNTNGGTLSGLTLALTLPTDAVLEYYNGITWVPATSPFTVGNLSPKQIRNLPFRVTLSTLGSNNIVVALMNGATSIDSDSTTVTIEGNFSVTGTFAMQGRTVRSGIPVSFSLPTYAPPAVLTLDQLVNNLSATLLYNGIYTITTNQARYLNVTPDLKKTVVVPRVLPLTALTLRGGNVTDVGASLNKVDLADATMIGDAYGDTGDPLTLLADANFDGKVNIQDLAMVGGNYDFTAVVAYGPWVP